MVDVKQQEHMDPLTREPDFCAETSARWDKTRAVKNQEQVPTNPLDRNMLKAAGILASVWDQQVQTGEKTRFQIKI